MTETPQPQARKNNFSLPVLYFFLVLFLTLYLAVQYVDPISKLVVNTIQSVQYEYGLDYGEGPLLAQAVRLSQFQNIYPKNLQNPPYLIANYPPLYPLSLTPFIWIFGPQLWYARLVSLVSVLLSGVIIGLIIHKLTRNWLAAAFAGLTFWVMPYVIHWAPLARVDSLALVLSLAGLYVIVSNPAERKNRIWAAVLITLSIYTKQSYGLVAPAAGFLYLLYEKPRRKAFEFAGWVALLGGSLLILLTIFTSGGFFLHVFTANVNPFHWDTVLYYATEIKDHFLLFFILGGLYLLGGVWKGIRQPAWWLVAPYFLLGAAVAITIGKEGSNVNYLYEMCVGIALLTGALLGIHQNKPNLRWIQFLLMLALVFPIQGAIQRSMDEYVERHPRTMAHIIGLMQLQREVDKVEGNVLADEYMSLVVTSGKPLLYQPFEFKMLNVGGLWDQTDFVRSIENQEYDLILLYDPMYWDSRNARWTPEQLAAIDANYRSYKRLGETRVYTPIRK